MATVNFIYRSLRPEANLILRLLFRIDKKDFVYSENTKIKVAKDYYVNEKNSITGKVILSPFNKVFSNRASSDVDIRNRNTAAIKIQDELKDELKIIGDFILNKFEGTDPSEINKNWLTEKIDDFYNPKKNEVIPTDLVSFFDYYIHYRRNDMALALFLKNKTIRDKLKTFQIYRNKTILVRDVNELFMNEFIDYYKQKKYAHNTAQREFAFIKTVCRKAKFLGLEVSHQLDALTIKLEKIKHIHLTFAELDKINTTEFKGVKTKLHTFTSNELNDAKDWLIISAFSGQRISDFMRFSIDMIKIREGSKFLAFTQQKTKTEMIIAIHNKIIQILDKRGFKFPDRITDQRYNLLLKEVCKQAEINEIVEGGLMIDDRKVYGKYPKYQLVCSHIGRRSFATNFYGKIKTNQLKNMTGHSTEKNLMVYLGDTSDDDALEISKIFSLDF